MVKFANYGKIYRFDDGKSSRPRFVVVVSTDRRATDKLVNILFLSETSSRYDSVPIQFVSPENDQYVTMFVNCGLVTYTPRAYLTDEIGSVADVVMDKISANICRQVSPRPQYEEELALAKQEAEAFKRAYSRLLVEKSVQEVNGNGC